MVGFSHRYKCIEKQCLPSRTITLRVPTRRYGCVCNPLRRVMTKTVASMRSITLQATLNPNTQLDSCPTSQQAIDSRIPLETCKSYEINMITSVWNPPIHSGITARIYVGACHNSPLKIVYKLMSSFNPHIESKVHTIARPAQMPIIESKIPSTLRLRSHNTYVRIVRNTLLIN